jgi:acetylornithine deacetylase/succinyl-diaminopimelate desuccinylase-like protein
MLTPDASVTQLFLELVAIPSPSGRERALADQIREWLSAHRVTAHFDRAGAANGSDAGNLIATVPGDAGAPTYLFLAHMDTVESGVPPVSPQLDDDGVIRSDGQTILGADNKSAVAAAMRLCVGTAGLPVRRRPTVRVAFTCREESGTMGASLLEDAVVWADCAFSLDGSKPIGTVMTKALGQQVFGFWVHGRRAHAAANPEDGVSAIRVAAEIVAALPLGRQPQGGSMSIAAIVGGAVIDRLSPAALRDLGADADGLATVRSALDATPTNSVPDLVLLRGEVRGYSMGEMHAAVAAIAEVATRVCDAHGARQEWASEPGRLVPPFPEGRGSRALELVASAAETVPGARFAREQAHATLEANYLAARTDVVAVASGGKDPHQLSESITVAELEQLEALLLAIVETGRQGG